jgi:hypothetical protein
MQWQQNREQRHSYELPFLRGRARRGLLGPARGDSPPSPLKLRSFELRSLYSGDVRHFRFWGNRTLGRHRRMTESGPKAAYRQRTLLWCTTGLMMLVVYGRGLA